MPPRRSHLLFEQILPNAADGELPGLRALPVASVDPNPDQPRKAPLRGIEDLAASIQAYGLLQPIVVRRKGDDRYTCIAGHRRLAAYAWLLDHDQERARWIEIPAIERDAHTDDLLVLALLENLSREELSEAEIITGLRLLHDLRGWSQREIARRLGVSSGWITKYFRVAGDAEVSTEVQAGAFSVGKGYEIVVAKSPVAKARALQAAREGAPAATVRRLAAGEPLRNEAPQRDGAGEEAGRPSGAAVTSGGTGEAATEGTASGEAAEDDAREPLRNEAPPWQMGQAIATAPVAAGVRDLAELADELGLTVDLRELQLFKLVQAAIRGSTTTVSLGQFLRLNRADQRMAEALVRAQGRPPKPAA